MHYYITVQDYVNIVDNMFKILPSARNVFQLLSNIGGCKKYHQEGEASIHTALVINEMKKLRPDDEFAIKLACLHDIGKIYTGIQKEDGDWEYPDHSTCGGFRGILCKFLPQSDPDFEKYQWYITNHIKPLFWQKYGINTTKMPEGCSLELLRDLAVCDIKGSVSEEPQTELITYLENLLF